MSTSYLQCFQTEIQRVNVKLEHTCTRFIMFNVHNHHERVVWVNRECSSGWQCLACLLALDTLSNTRPQHGVRLYAVIEGGYNVVKYTPLLACPNKHFEWLVGYFLRYNNNNNKALGIRLILQSIKSSIAFKYPLIFTCLDSGCYDIAWCPNSNSTD